MPSSIDILSANWIAQLAIQKEEDEKIFAAINAIVSNPSIIPAIDSISETDPYDGYEVLEEF